jgi:hypothetical protein
VPDGTPPPVRDNPVTDYTPSGRPGGRAWRDVERPRGAPLDVLTIGEGADLADPDRARHTAYGVDEGGAVLVRPDGYVAWRAASAVKTPRAALHAAVASIVARS